MMSETPISRDHFLSKSEQISESSSNRIFAKPYVEHSHENAEGKQRNNIKSSVHPSMNGDEAVNRDVEVMVAEVEYIESENLDDLEDVDKSLKMLIPGLESKDWVLLCDTLNNVRRFSIYHKEALEDKLEIVISLLVKSLKNPRSAVCKTGIMTSADIFKAFGDHIIDFLDPLFVQLLLKSSQDKRFVCDAAEKALVALTTWVSPGLLLPKLQPYLKNRNPRIRAKVSMCFSRCVRQLGVDEVKAFGIDKLIQIAASQLSDQLPESREAARALLLELQTAYEKSPALAPEPDAAPSEQPTVHSWERFCESNLSKLSAQAVLRVTGVAREGLVAGCKTAEKKVAEWLLDQKLIGVDFEYPHKKPRYIHLKTQAMFNNLVELYHNWFASVWNHIYRITEEFGLTSEASASKSLKLARIYISCWFKDLYYYIHRALSKTDTFPTLVRYDTFLTDLLNAIRPTHIVHNPADEMLIPLIVDNPNMLSDNPFGIENFNLSTPVMLAVNRVMIEKKLCSFGNITDATVGSPAWLFDYVTHNNEDALYSWFPAEGNYTSHDLTLAFIIGCACSPRIGPIEIDEWRWYPRNASDTWNPPAFDGRYISDRHNYGSVELTTVDIVKNVTIPNYYYDPNASKTGDGPMYLPVSATTPPPEVSHDENTEVPESPTAADTTYDANADIVQMDCYRYVTKIYHAQVARNMLFTTRYAVLQAYLQD